jgi:Leucine-rich repeat (LRR) protein
VTLPKRTCLGANFPSGNIPSKLGYLTNLTILELEKNKLSGTIPTVIGNLTGLDYLYLNINAFEGDVPSQFTNP